MSHFKKIISHTPVYDNVLRSARMVAATDVTVLIKGETGTGKEVLANAIQKDSQRADKPYVTLNCAALPESLIESELFGHRKGSFTGAISDKKGIFQAADGGTLFLDEINSLPTLSAPDGMIVSRRRREICQSEVRDSARGRLKFYPE